MTSHKSIGLQRASFGRAKHERNFYSAKKVFGRLGMRCFSPYLMPEPHWHGHVEANFVTGGSLTYLFDDREVIIPENRLVLFWAGIPHQLIAINPGGDVPVRLNNLYLPADSFLYLPHIGKLQASLLAGGLAMLPASLCTIETVALWYSDYRAGDFERLEVMKMELNAMLRRAQTQEITYLSQPATQPDSGRVISSAQIHHVVGMVSYILKNLNNPISNADVAQVTGLHENYAANLFSKVMRLPVKRFIIRMRLLRARAQLIENTTAISQIAENCGFSSISQFYEHFTAAYRLSPHSLRKRYTNFQLGDRS